jgi:hypothetical protein
MSVYFLASQAGGWFACTAPKYPVGAMICARIGVALAIVGSVFDDGSEDVAMHDWMIGLGFIVLLVTPCFIAMWSGVESVDES